MHIRTQVPFVFGEDTKTLGNLLNRGRGKILMCVFLHAHVSVSLANLSFCACTAACSMMYYKPPPRGLRSSFPWSLLGQELYCLLGSKKTCCTFVPWCFVKNMFISIGWIAKGRNLSRRGHLKEVKDWKINEDLRSRTAWDSSFPTFSRTSPRKLARSCGSLSLPRTQVSVLELCRLVFKCVGWLSLGFSIPQQHGMVKTIPQCYYSCPVAYQPDSRFKQFRCGVRLCGSVQRVDVCVANIRLSLDGHRSRLLIMIRKYHRVTSSWEFCASATSTKKVSLHFGFWVEEHAALIFVHRCGLIFLDVVDKNCCWAT